MMSNQILSMSDHLKTLGHYVLASEKVIASTASEGTPEVNWDNMIFFLVPELYKCVTTWRSVQNYPWDEDTPLIRKSKAEC